MKTKAQKALAGRASPEYALGYGDAIVDVGRLLSKASAEYAKSDELPIMYAVNRLWHAVSALPDNADKRAARSAPVSRPSRRGGTHPAQQLPKKEG